MAIEIIEQSLMLAQNYEPLRTHQWILAMDRNDLDAFAAKSWARPSFSIQETKIDFINDYRYLAGKMEPQTFQLTLLDPIAPSESQKVMEWINLSYEQLTGRAGYAAVYKKTINLKMLDPAGAVAQTWEMRGTWINNVDFGTLDYTSYDPITCTLTLRFDKAIILS